MSSTAPFSYDDLDKFLGQLVLWGTAASMNRKISPKDTEEIARLRKSCAQLLTYRQTYRDRSGGDMPDKGPVPGIAKMQGHIETDDFPAVIAEAKQIRDLMKPILQQAKAKVDALRK